LLGIAPVAARVTANKTTMTNAPTLLAVVMAVGRVGGAIITPLTLPNGGGSWLS